MLSETPIAVNLYINLYAKPYQKLLTYLNIRNVFPKAESY